MNVLKLATMGAALVGATSANAAVVYQITDLGTLGGTTSFAYAINAGGQVVGSSQTPSGQQHAFLYSNGTITDLGTLGGPSSVAYGINDQGQIVGESATSPYFAHAFLYGGTVMTDLTPSAGSSYARAINDAGQIVGSVDTTQGTRAFIDGNGTFAELGTLPGDTSSLAYAINAIGQVAGLSWNSNEPASALHAFSYSDQELTSIDPTNPFDTYANGINNQGTIVGQRYGVAFATSGASIVVLGTLATAWDDENGVNASSVANGINSAGMIVGTSTVAGIDYAFIDDGSAMIDLNTLIDPASGWTLNDATAINDDGWIVGYGLDGSAGGAMHAFLLTPVPEPASLALLAAGVPLLLRKRCRA